MSPYLKVTWHITCFNVRTSCAPSEPHFLREATWWRGRLYECVCACACYVNEKCALKDTEANEVRLSPASCLPPGGQWQMGPRRQLPGMGVGDQRSIRLRQADEPHVSSDPFWPDWLSVICLPALEMHARYAKKKCTLEPGPTVLGMNLVWTWESWRFVCVMWFHWLVNTHSCLSLIQCTVSMFSFSQKIYLTSMSMYSHDVMVHFGSLPAQRSQHQV